MLLPLLLNNLLSEGGEPPETEFVGLYAANGSINISVDDGLGAIGVYSPTGALRISTGGTSGLYAADGSMRGEISTNEASPASGVGIYSTSGALRLTTSTSAYFNVDGLYARDGSIKVTEI